MPSLAKIDTRFSVIFDIVEGGSGSFRGTITEPESVPSRQLSTPMRLLKVPNNMPVSARMVVRDMAGDTYILGEHGVSQSRGGILFRELRMVKAKKTFEWKTRGKTIDAITGLERDSELEIQGFVYGAYEPMPEQFDRQLRSNFELGKFITNAKVKRNDMIDGMKVERVDELLGISLVELG